ncbi:MAG: ABC transporter ATP-binding protein [Acidobacteria bacterium]|nr:MAG: ABC transporter ATP-binding protein [Acidobacteriota bacterium]
MCSILRVEGLTKRFPAFGKGSHETLAVDAIHLEVQAGEVFGLLGPNGAGKTTMVRMLCALISPTAGRAWINGFELGPDNDSIRASVGVLTESPGLYRKLDAVTNLSFFAKLYGVRDIAGQVDKYLRMLGLWDARYQLAGSFSKGMRQKLAIARALLHEPPLVFLDEPTASLDPEAARVVRDFIEELRGRGRTIVLCTHNLDEADRLCDRIGVIKQKFLCIDSPARLRRQLYGSAVRVRLEKLAPEYANLLRGLPFVKQVEASDGALIVRLEDPATNNPTLVRVLVTAGAGVRYLEELSVPLESVYFDVMGQQDQDVRQEAKA